MITPPRALILSPSATHPQDYGNRNRVWQVTKFFRDQGYAVDFLFYPIEGEWNDHIPPEAEDMSEAWDGFWVVPPSAGYKFHQPAAGYYHEVDEWWDDALGNFLQWLFARRTYDVFVVNYTFLSKAFTYAPKTTLKILETHDLFTGRREMLEALGVEPEFFYTDEQQERIAFDRSDIVIAIKDGEAEIMQHMTSREVVSLPFYPTGLTASPESDTGFRGLSVGFVGAGNSINTVNFQAFLRKFDPLVRTYCPPLRLIVAGNVARKLDFDNPAFSRLGWVADLKDFYDQVDVVVAPMALSTGIKIKVGEALGNGKGVVATRNGFDGFPVLDPMHKLDSMRDVAKALIQLAFDPERRAILIERSRESARLAHSATQLAFQGLASSVLRRSPRIVFLTDTPYWAGRGIRAERLEQWIQLCGYLARKMTFFVTADPQGTAARSFDRLPDTRIFGMADECSSAEIETLADELAATFAQLGQVEVMVSIDKPWAGDLCEALIARGYRPVMDLWCPSLAALARRSGAGLKDDLWFCEARDRGRGLEASALRYSTIQLNPWVTAAPGRRILALVGAPWPEHQRETFRLTMAEQGEAVEFVSIAQGRAAIDEAFELFGRGERPELMLAIDVPLALERACQTVSLLSGIPFLAFEAASFPAALPMERGAINLHQTPADFVAAILARLRQGLPAIPVRHTVEAGWNLFWRLVDERLQRSLRDEPEPESGAPPAGEEPARKRSAPLLAVAG